MSHEQNKNVLECMHIINMIVLFYQEINPIYLRIYVCFTHSTTKKLNTID